MRKIRALIGIRKLKVEYYTMSYPASHALGKWHKKFFEWSIVISFTLSLGCSAVSPEESGDGLSQQECRSFAELLIDPEFQTVGDRESVWRYRQHTGERSFSAVSEEGTLTFARIGGEPWAVLSQKITSPLLSGREVVYSVDLKGDVSANVNHAFGAKSGLYLRRGFRKDASQAEHEPSVGQWDWQPVSISATVAESHESVEIGFLYQGGAGALSAKNPTLQLVECMDKPR